MIVDHFHVEPGGKRPDLHIQSCPIWFVARLFRILCGSLRGVPSDEVVDQHGILQSSSEPHDLTPNRSLSVEYAPRKAVRGISLGWHDSDRLGNPPKGSVGRLEIDKGQYLL